MTSNTLKVAEAFLAQVDEDWQRLVTAVGACTLQTHPQRQPWEALVRAVAYQQLHTKAGDAILGRLLQQFPGQSFPQPAQLLALDDAVLQTCGFSTSKRTTLRSIAAAALSGDIPSLKDARAMQSEPLIQQLTSLKGIGRWTVEMILMDSLERMDIWPVSDYGVREGYRRLKQLPQPLTPRQLYPQGDNLSPWRSIAAWYLWRLPETGLFPAVAAGSKAL